MQHRFVANYHSTLHNIRKVWRSHLHLGRCLKSCLCLFSCQLHAYIICMQPLQWGLHHGLWVTGTGTTVSSCGNSSYLKNNIQLNLTAWDPGYIQSIIMAAKMLWLHNTILCSVKTITQTIWDMRRSQNVLRIHPNTLQEKKTVTIWRNIQLLVSSEQMTMSLNNNTQQLYDNKESTVTRKYLMWVLTTAEWWYLGAGGVPVPSARPHDFSFTSNLSKSFNIIFPLSPPKTYIASSYATAVCLLLLQIVTEYYSLII